MKTYPHTVPAPVKTSGRTGIPGLDARSRGFSAALTPLISMVFGGGFVLGAILKPSFLQGWHAGVLLMLIAGGFFITWKRAVLIYLRHEEGARGEEQVARVLEAMPDSWNAFHGVPCGEKKLDHVLVGPDQVFCIETVHWKGPVRVINGKIMHGDQFYPGYELKSMKKRAEEFAGELGLPAAAVTPMVCIVGGRYGEHPGMKDQIWLGEIQDLGTFLLGEHFRGLQKDVRAGVVENLEALFEQGDV